MEPSSESVAPEVAKKTTKETKGPRWQEFESKALALFCKDNQDLLFGSSGGAGVESVKRKTWQKAVEIVRAAGGSVREWQATRKKWQDLSYRAKAYKNKRDGKTVTGGGPQPIYNGLHELVLDCMPDELTEGLIVDGSCETVPEITAAAATTVDLTEPSCSGQPRKRRAVVLAVDTETETDSQTQEEDEVLTITAQQQHTRKQKHKKKKRHSREASSAKSSSGKEVDKIDMLALNKQLLNIESEKLSLRKDALEVQRETVEVLKQINFSLQKLIPSSSSALSSPPSAFALLNTMLEQ